MYELRKKLEKYLRVNLLGPGPRLTKKRIYRAAVSQRLGNTALRDIKLVFFLIVPRVRRVVCSVFCAAAKSGPVTSVL
jgi:hypothetical protein